MSHSKIIEPHYERGLVFEQDISDDFFNSPYADSRQGLDSITCVYENTSDTHLIVTNCFFLNQEIKKRDKLCFYLTLAKKEKLKMIDSLEYSLKITNFNRTYTKKLMINELNEDNTHFKLFPNKENIATQFGNLFDSLIEFYRPLITSDNLEQFAKLLSPKDTIDSLFIRALQSDLSSKYSDFYSIILQTYITLQSNNYISDDSYEFTEEKYFYNYLLIKFIYFSKELHVLVQEYTSHISTSSRLNISPFLFSIFLKSLTISKAVFIHYDLDFENKDYNVSFLNKRHQVVKENIEYIYEGTGPIIILYKELREVEVRYICFRNENEEEATLLDIKSLIGYIKRS